MLHARMCAPCERCSDLGLARWPCLAELRHARCEGESGWLVRSSTVRTAREWSGWRVWEVGCGTNKTKVDAGFSPPSALYRQARLAGLHARRRQNRHRPVIRLLSVCVLNALGLDSQAGLLEHRPELLFLVEHVAIHRSRRPLPPVLHVSLPILPVQFERQ
eukprot:3935621-Rhodomonas_salina.1